MPSSMKLQIAISHNNYMLNRPTGNGVIDPLFSVAMKKILTETLNSESIDELSGYFNLIEKFYVMTMKFFLTSY